MAEPDHIRCRLCLVTPSAIEAAAFAQKLADALSGGDVASLIITAPDPDALADAANRLVPIAAERGVAALIHNDREVAKSARADGLHVDSGTVDLAGAVEALRPKHIVGAGGVTSRHEAMTAGELNPDYVFFGRLDGDTGPEIFPKALDLATWWSSMFVIPALVMGGNALASVREAASASIEFVALRTAVWEHPEGPAAAVAEANRLLSLTAEPA